MEIKEKRMLVAILFVFMLSVISACSENQPVSKDSGLQFVDGGSSSGVRGAKQCGDSLDNDGDGLVDYPNDPGCSSKRDTSEKSSSLVCDDGLDNDGDGLVDYPNDPGCGGPTDPNEVDDPTCTDSDGGYAPLLQGTVSGLWNNIPYIYTDFCVFNSNATGDLVQEYSCNGIHLPINSLASCLYYGKTSCVNGACV